MRCIGEDGLARYLAGDLDYGHHREVEAHLSHCGPCNQILDELTMRTEIRAVGGDATGQLAIGARSSDKILWLERHYGLQIGDEIDGKYRIEKIIGEGGMGIVVRATHLALREHVALKFMHPSMADNEVHAARFVREARAAVRLREEHVARVLDLGEVADNGPYIVMEYLEGEDLLAYLKKHAPLPIAEAVALCRQAASGVAAAHEAGIVHRDLKPGNMFLTDKRGEKVLKVLDFGVSKYLEGDSLAVTGTNMVVGSPMYMAPELLESARNATPASDVWALGVILYRMITGRLPFFGESLPELVAKVHFGGPTPIDHWRRDVPADITAVIHRCLARRTGDRFADARTLLEALDRLPIIAFRAGTDADDMPPGLLQTLPDNPAMPISPSAPIPLASAAPTTPPGLEGVAPSSRSLRPWLFTLVGAAVASALFLGILTARTDSKPSESQPTPAGELDEGFIDFDAGPDPSEVAPPVTPDAATGSTADSDRPRSTKPRKPRRPADRPRVKPKPKEPVLLIPDGD